MKTREEIKEYVNNKIIDLVTRGAIISEYKDSGNIISFYHRDKSGRFLFEIEIEYEALQKDDICECWNNDAPKDKELLYFTEYYEGKPRFRDVKSDTSTCNFDNYQLVERVRDLIEKGKRQDIKTVRVIDI